MQENKGVNMQVSLNSQNRVRPQFGMAIKATPESLERLGSKFTKVADWVEFDKLVTRENNNDVAHVLLSTGKNGKLVAQVGPRTFVEGFFGGPIKAINKAVDSAENLRERHDAVKLEADADYIRTIRNNVEHLPSQKAPAAESAADDVVEFLGDAPINRGTVVDISE